LQDEADRLAAQQLGRIQGEPDSGALDHGVDRAQAAGQRAGQRQPERHPVRDLDAEPL
jgi:hypothetical protein